MVWCGVGSCGVFKHIESTWWGCLFKGRMNAGVGSEGRSCWVFKIKVFGGGLNMLDCWAFIEILFGSPSGWFGLLYWFLALILMLYFLGIWVEIMSIELWHGCDWNVGLHFLLVACVKAFFPMQNNVIFAMISVGWPSAIWGPKALCTIHLQCFNWSGTNNVITYFLGRELWQLILGL